MNKKTLDLIGLSKKTNKLVIGSDDTINLIKKKKIELVIVDNKYLSSTYNQIKKICELNNIPLINTISLDDLNKSIGMNGVRVIGITDKGFKELIFNSL